MPLDKSGTKEAFSRNVATEMHAGKKQNQALAIAYAVKRRGRAAGGQLGPGAFNISPKQMVRNEARTMTHAGPILSAVGGRTDHHALAVKSGSYILPADHVSSLGQGNTNNGMAVLNHMFKSAPYGGSPMKITHGAGAPKPAKLKLASGGSSDKGGARGHESGEPVPIYAAGGEYTIPPEVVMQIGGGSLAAGHKILDHWVVENRKKHVATLRKLPPPAKS